MPFPNPNLRTKATSRSLGSNSFDPGKISGRSSFSGVPKSTPRAPARDAGSSNSSWWSRLKAPLRAYGTNPGFGGAAPGRSMKKSQMSQTEGY